MQDNEPYIIGKRRTVRRVYWKRIAVTAVIICLIVIGGVLWFSRTRGSYETEGRTYWFVSMGEYTDGDKAAAYASVVSESGGAGYVVDKNGYMVAAACYSDRNDAETVSARLTGEGENNTVISLKCAALSIPKPKSGGELLKKLLPVPGEMFDELYDISLKTDTKEISEAAALYAAYKMRLECEEYAASSQSIEGKAGEYLHGLFDALARSFGTLAGENDKIPQKIKYTLCDCAVKICSLTGDFSDKIKNLS